MSREEREETLVASHIMPLLMDKLIKKMVDEYIKIASVPEPRTRFIKVQSTQQVPSR